MEKVLIGNFFEDTNNGADTVHPIKAVHETGLVMMKYDIENKDTIDFVVGNISNNNTNGKITGLNEDKEETNALERKT